MNSLNKGGSQPLYQLNEYPRITLSVILSTKYRLENPYNLI